MLLLLALACRKDDGDGPSSPPSTSTTPPETTPPHTTPPPEDAERRWDCSGMDPADPAPLGGRVVLTFDDGPDPVDTPVVLEVLRAHGVPAAFLMLGTSLEDPAVWSIVDDIVADPLFVVGNHTVDHLDLADLDLPSAEAQIVDNADALADFGVAREFFRFPYGDSTCATHDLATGLGYRVAGWHIDTADWCYAAGGGVCTTDDYWRVPEEYADDMLGLSLEQIHRFDGGVVLFHDIHAFTAEHLEEFVTTLLDEGYTFAALDDEGVLPNLNAGTPADLPYLGERCSLADDRCWQVEHAAWCEPTDPGDPDSDDGICTLPCEGYCLDRDGAATTFCAATGGAGQCVARVDPRNDDCAALPGTVVADFERFVGSSGVEAAVAAVCAPVGW